MKWSFASLAAARGRLGSALVVCAALRALGVFRHRRGLTAEGSALVVRGARASRTGTTMKTIMMAEPH